MAHKTSNGVVHSFDITTFLAHIHTFLILFSPIIDSYYFACNVFSWRTPWMTISVWSMVNICCILIAPTSCLILSLGMLCLVMTVGIMYKRNHSFSRLFPDRALDKVSLQSYLHRTWGNEPKILAEYRKVLYELDKILYTVNEMLMEFYDILKWENVMISSCAFFCGGVVIISALTQDIRWTIFLLNNLSIMGTGMCIAVLRQRNKKSEYTGSTMYSTPIIQFDDSPRADSPDENSRSIITYVNQPSGEVNDSDSASGLVQDDESMISVEATKSTVSEDTSGRSKTSVVRRLMDLRKRNQIASSCSSCGASFSSILKRRYSCCSCGNQFCSRCCSHRVPKSAFGVTAPATKNDMVSVCSPCYQSLQKQLETVNLPQVPISSSSLFPVKTPSDTTLSSQPPESETPVT